MSAASCLHSSFLQAVSAVMLWLVRAEKDGQRDRETETDRQTYTQTDRQTETDRQTKTETDRDRQAYRAFTVHDLQTDRQRGQAYHL